MRWLVAAVAVAGTVAYGAAVENMPPSPPLVVLGLGGLVLALAGMALWRIVDPLLRAGGEPAAGAGPPQAPGRLRDLEREKQAVLKAIKEIEFDYQMRKIAEPDYRDLVERYRRRALRVIAELDAGQAGDYRDLIERELKDRLAALEAAAAGARPSAASAKAEAAKAEAAPGATGDAAASAPAPRACAGCATSNDADAEFCKRCGTKLVA